MTPNEVREMLPKIGERMMLIPTVQTFPDIRPERYPAVVVEVCRRRMWFRVRFDCGFCECYKLPWPKLHDGLGDAHCRRIKAEPKLHKRRRKKERGHRDERRTEA